eukprot:CAMPEP_0185484036 /NCGR_PEP_ID=MMETSP1366-20130426/9008_1 /TAXON_ID=38817 /ORGANISM="Gephyrocapsa oceanica, Strain RCC1303" /LENGTH=128 /DNA_ID=CAMNT_0028092043 /DNA_START=1 /DNA_END=388 /DNA_ORIENTATION=-
MPGLEPFHARQIRTGERVLGHRVSPRDAATHPPTLIHSALMTPPHSQSCTRPSLRRRAAPLHLVDRADDELDLAFSLAARSVSSSATALSRASRALLNWTASSSVICAWKPSPTLTYTHEVSGMLAST